jgi:surface antigen
VLRLGNAFSYTCFGHVCTRLGTRILPAVIAGTLSSACSMSLPMVSLSARKDPEPVLTTASVPAPVPRAGNGPSLSDHLGPEDLRRATGALALALDPQGNGSSVAWDNAESKSSGRFTPVGGPFLKDYDVCRAFLAQVQTVMQRQALQGTACRPSGSQWVIQDLKPWKEPG